MHTSHGHNEWSGELITSEQGSITDIENWIITAQEIFLADLGTPGFTGYEVDKGGFKSADIIQMYTEYPGLLDGTLKNHHIHSHHSMGAFFSGTDWENLNDRSLVSNYFMMLIVNIAGNYVAKVAFKAVKTGGGKKQLVFSNNLDGIPPIPLEEDVDKEMLVVMDCKISHINKTVDDVFRNRYSALIATKKREEEEKATTYNYRNNYGATGLGYNTNLRKPQEFAFGYTPGYSVDRDRYGNVLDDKKLPAAKSIMEMTEDEWLAENRPKSYSLDDDRWVEANIWDEKDAVCILNYALKGTIRDYTDCKNALQEEKPLYGTFRDDYVSQLWYKLQNGFNEVYPEAGNFYTEFYTVCGFLCQYLKKFNHIWLVPPLIDIIVEETENATSY